MFEPEKETMSVHEREKFQNKRLPHIVRRAYQNVTMYHDKLNDRHLTDIRGQRDFEKLPFTTKKDLRNYSFRDRLALPTVELVRYLSSETTERAIVFGLTPQDLELQAICCAKTFSCATITREDTVLEIFPAGLFPVWVAQQGLQKLGAKIIHTLPGRTRELQIPILLGKFEASIKPTVMTSLASYLLRIAEVAQDDEIDPRTFGVNKLVVSSAMETLSDNKRRIIEDTYDASMYDVLGLVEVAGGPSIGGECRERNGLHIWENYFYIEVVDLNTHERLGLGEEGELVITSLENLAHPIIRYKTGIITKLLAEEKCACGRTNVKISRSMGRADDILDVKGFLLDPKEIEDVLLSIPGVGAEYRIIIRKIGGLDDILIITEIEAGYRGQLNAFDQSIATDLLAKEIERTFKSTFNITPKVEIVPYDTMKRGNVTRFLDLRKPS
jgi:phenylacetate-CoA ligase